MGMHGEIMVPIGPELKRLRTVLGVNFASATLYGTAASPFAAISTARGIRRSRARVTTNPLNTA